MEYSTECTLRRSFVYEHFVAWVNTKKPFLYLYKIIRSESPCVRVLVLLSFHSTPVSLLTKDMTMIYTLHFHNPNCKGGSVSKTLKWKIGFTLTLLTYMLEYHYKKTHGNFFWCFYQGVNPILTQPQPQSHIFLHPVPLFAGVTVPMFMHQRLHTFLIPSIGALQAQSSNYKIMASWCRLSLTVHIF